MIKPLINIILVVFFCQSISAQKRIYIDENNDTISKNEVNKKWNDKNLYLSNWIYIGADGVHYVKLKNDKFLKGNLDYSNIKTHLESLIGREIENESIILLEYVFKDDLCSTMRNNKWTKYEIGRRKSFFKPMLKQFSDKKIFFISLYEKGITLKNRPKNKNEYFYNDINNFFREKIFTSPTICGSFALIKPNGETLIRNGEYRPDLMAEYLKPKNWNQFFNK